MDITKVHKVKIHPAIGIARLGNSQDEYYIGPEAPGIPADNGGSFRDGVGAIKRQAARFRIYAYDTNNAVLAELTHGDGISITWTVTLANTKGAFDRFVGLFGTPGGKRNPDITDRSSLCVTPSPKSISGAEKRGVSFDDGSYVGNPVYLGELRTDAAGCLLVLGGHGVSKSVRKPPAVIDNYANNDGWYDDTSDGSVRAAVSIAGKEIVAEGAWVIAAPPKFAPQLQPLPNLYEVVYDTVSRPDPRAAPTGSPPPPMRSPTDRIPRPRRSVPASHRSAA